MFPVKQPPPGVFMTIDDQRLHVVTIGSGPTVVLCGGLAGNWFDWDDCARILARFHTVVVFDRPGFGLSEALPRDRTPTVKAEADRILGVLDGLELARPAVVVGHSLAGFYAEAFARLYPDRASGLLLLDSSVARNPRRLLSRRFRLTISRALATVVSRSGLQNVLGPSVRTVLNHSVPPDGIPMDTLDWASDIYRRRSYLNAALVENAVYPDLAAELEHIRTHTTLTAPVIVAAAHTGRPTPWGWAWLATQKRLARELDARFTVVDDAHHHAMIDRPDRVAALVAELVSSHKDTNT